jgi:hypothetical protein
MLIDEIQLLQREEGHPQEGGDSPKAKRPPTSQNVFVIDQKEEELATPDQKPISPKADQQDSIAPQVLTEQEKLIEDLNAKLKDLEYELSLPDADFEKKLTDRLREEIRANRARVDEDFKRELAEEKKRIVEKAKGEKEAIKRENKMMEQEIARMKVLIRSGAVNAMGAGLI